MKQSLIEAFNRITFVQRPACYTWFYSGYWFACGFIYNTKEFGKLIAIQYGEEQNYIIQIVEGRITIKRFDATEV